MDAVIIQEGFLALAIFCLSNLLTVVFSIHWRTFCGLCDLQLRIARKSFRRCACRTIHSMTVIFLLTLYLASQGCLGFSKWNHHGDRKCLADSTHSVVAATAVPNFAPALGTQFGSRGTPRFCHHKPHMQHRIPTSRQRRRAGKLSLSEMLFIMVFFHVSGFRCFTLYYLYGVCGHYRHLFRDLPSYGRFVALQPRLFMPLCMLLHHLSGEKLVHTRHRSPTNAMVHILSCIAAYQISPNKPTMNTKP